MIQYSAPRSWDGRQLWEVWQPSERQTVPVSVFGKLERDSGGNNFLSASCKPASNLCFVARRRFIEEDPGIEKVNLAKGGLQIINIYSTLLRSKYVFVPRQTKAKVD